MKYGTLQILCQFFKMAYYRNDSWKEDLSLKGDMENYVKQMLQRKAKQNKMLVSGFIAKFYMGRSVRKTFYFFKNISSLEICR